MKLIYFLLILCLSLQNVMVLSESVKKTHLQKPRLGAKNPHLKHAKKAPALKKAPLKKAPELKAKKPVLKDANHAHEHAHDDGLSTATIVFIVMGVLLAGVIGMVILKVRKKNKKKGDKLYTIIEDQEQQINTLNF